MREWARRNPDKVRAIRDRRREQRKAEKKAWDERNRDHVRAYRRRPEVAKAHNISAARFKREHPLKRREWEARRRARLKANGIEPVNYEALIERDKSVCGICKLPVSLDDIEFDHIVPIALGGPHTEANLQVTHATCNARKGARAA